MSNYYPWPDSIGTPVDSPQNHYRLPRASAPRWITTQTGEQWHYVSAGDRLLASIYRANEHERWTYGTSTYVSLQEAKAAVEADFVWDEGSGRLYIR